METDLKALFPEETIPADQMTPGQASVLCNRGSCQGCPLYGKTDRLCLLMGAPVGWDLEALHGIDVERSRLERAPARDREHLRRTLAETGRYCTTASCTQCEWYRSGICVLRLTRPCDWPVR